MAEITVAVPVWNGASMLRGCLENLRTQTFEDLKVVVYDNASTDATPEIAADFAARDRRFSLIRHPHNIGAAPNFTSALEDATTPFFSWRAFDDYSTPDFYARLHELLLAHPNATFAGAMLKRVLPDGSTRVVRFPDYPPASPALRAAYFLKRCVPSWTYGLFRREPLLESVASVNSLFAGTNGWGQLVLAPLIVRGGAVGTNEACFIKRTGKWNPGQRPNYALENRAALGRAFLKIAFRAIAAERYDFLSRLFLQYRAFQRAVSLARSRRVAIVELFGIER